MRAATQLVCVLITVAPPAQAAVPGTFFWKPRVGLDIAVPTATSYSRNIIKPTWDNIAKGFVVLMDGYHAGTNVAALASYLQDVSKAYPHLHPGMAHYYTNMYRWAVRHLSLLPEWMSGRTNHYVNTHKAWRKRYFYMKHFVPQWMRKILFFVEDESWKYEEWEWKKFEKYAEPYFGKFYRYPSKKFNNYNSFRQAISVENMDATENSIDPG